MRTPHIVPLSRQAIDILKQIQAISGHLELVFPGNHNPYKPMCENTVNKALRLMGYDTKTDVCGHGFRAMAYSALMESGLWSQDAVERQMSHQERNTVRLAYIHKAEHLEARKAMMQWWLDYLDTCPVSLMYHSIFRAEQSDTSSPDLSITHSEPQRRISLC
ncbi:phage integrase family protein [Samsonia erythrinae]|uniref:Phage integrase family protein n=1 Tax=Samsonia erythrinae TaxID=160434 RepID=A0A4R3VPU0_9GAMM|nr:phage integrase family protein [Samsonia erythrinae]